MDAAKSAVHGSSGSTPLDTSDTAAYMDVEHSETTDSGVQLLDSESTMNASMVISGCFDDFASPSSESTNKQILAPCDHAGAVAEEHPEDICNSNIPAGGDTNEGGEERQKQDEELNGNESIPLQMDDPMVASQCSTFDTTEAAVFRRRPKKTKSSNNPPKKRVSFHEDILKNTKTDNIHIEHGFITYNKNGGTRKHSTATSGRYSWCSSSTGAEANGPDAELHQATGNTDEPEYVIYRNACSEVLDYGNTDIYDGEGERPKCDNSGVFEYADSQNGNAPPVGLYKCHCSDSNSSLESNAAGVDVNSNEVRSNYAQTKSSSCDCIGAGQQPEMTDNCYYSEPNIGGAAASVWSKEKKPKSSCLKKTKYTDFVASLDSDEQKGLKTKALQTFNIHGRKRTSKTTTTSSTSSANNSIFGSLRNIFSMPLPERGVPEGQEDAQAVHEEEEETGRVDSANSPDDTFPVQPSPRSFLSKSFDGGFHHESHVSPNKKKFIHSVDEQLRKKSDQERSSPKRSAATVARSFGSATDHQHQQSPVAATASVTPQKQEVYRNKFIINCESTVFEHTGISYSYESAGFLSNSGIVGPGTETSTTSNAQSSFLSQKISKWTNMFRTTNAQPPVIKSPKAHTNNIQGMPFGGGPGNDPAVSPLLPNAANDVMECSFASSNSTMTDVSSIVSTPTASSSATTTTTGTSDLTTPSGDGFSKIFGSGGAVGNSPSHSLTSASSNNNRTPTRHLSSPCRKKSLPRYTADDEQQRSMAAARMSPDLFNNYVQFMGSRAPMNDLRTSSLLSEDFDDILTITTSDASSAVGGLERLNEDLVIVDYPEITIPDHPDDSDFMKPASSKSSLINRFLRNVTQKKIMEATIALNKKLVAGAGAQVATGRPVVGKLYVRGVRPMNRELIEDLNAEIAIEIEQNRGGEGPVVKGVQEKERRVPVKENPAEANTMEGEGNGFGVGEIPVDTFRGNSFPFIGALLPEFLMKVFKLYIGYTRDGIMTPVLVFLTNKTLYVTDLVRSTLCNKFVMPYAELDVILLGPYGNTVLLCNGDRDMQQVLLAGGPNQANALVSSLEICARRGGLMLPSIGQLTLDHLAPLQNFVRDSSKTVDRREKWLYYAVVSVSPMTSTAGFTEVEEQLGANINGPLMHRSMNKAGMPVTQWSASYFLLKAGVLYMFPTTTTTTTTTITQTPTTTLSSTDTSAKLPSWAVTLTECQGVRRMHNAGRPHCFELLLKAGALQLAGSDEYAASDWMQALVQSASGLFELEEKRSHYGCTLVLTSSHIITLREDFTEPLKRVSSQKAVMAPEPRSSSSSSLSVDEAAATSDLSCSSTVSTPNRTTVSSGSGSTMVRKRSGGDVLTSSINAKTKEAAKEAGGYSKMFSQYGKDSGMEILSCADIGELVSVKVSERASIWWCSLEFSCQECVQENSDDVVVHFATESEHERFLSKLKEVWQAKTKDVSEFPLQRVDREDTFAEHCTKLFMDINKMWDPLVTAALGYPK